MTETFTKAQRTMVREKFEWAYDELIREGKLPRPAAMDALDWALRQVAARSPAARTGGAE